LVIHNISLPPGQFGSGDIERFFRNQLDKSTHPYFEAIAELKVSSHLLIERDGTVIQFVNFNDRAWHAGVSEFCGRDNCNDYSIGIELEGTDDTPYTAEQYHVLADITASLLKEYPALTEDRITGHNNIAPGRKTDPGPAFDWLRYRSEVTAFIEEQA
jgi:AmpD protein